MEGENNYLQHLLTKNLDNVAIHNKWFIEARQRSTLVNHCPKCGQVGSRKYKNSFSPVCCASGHVWWTGSGEMYAAKEPTSNWRKCLDKTGTDHYNVLRRRQLAKNITKAAETLEILSREKRRPERIRKRKREKFLGNSRA